MSTEFPASFASSAPIDPNGSPSPEQQAAAAVLAGRQADIVLALAGRKPIEARIHGRRERGAVLPLVLHFHGGSFVGGGLEEGGHVARLLASAGAVVLSIAYPLEPFPEPIEVGYAALEWLHKHRARLAGKNAPIYLAGEEAGGNLAAGVAMVARDRGHPPVSGQILLSPMLDPCAGTASLRKATQDETECRWAQGWKKFLRQPMNATHPYAVPGASLRLASLAPTLVLVGEDDAMRDEALKFADRLRGAGIAVTSKVLDSAARSPGDLYDPEFGDCACAQTVGRELREFFGSTASMPLPSSD